MRLCKTKLGTATLAGLLVAYLAALTAVSANPASIPPHGVQMMTQATNAATLAVLLATVAAFNRKCSMTTASGWTWAMLGAMVLNLAARAGVAAALSENQNLQAKYTRWDTAASVAGTLAVLAAVYYTMVPRTRLRSTFFVLGLVFVLPLVTALPGLIRRGGFHLPTAVAALTASGVAYQQFDKYADQTDRVTSVTIDGKQYIAFAGTENSQDLKADVNAGDTRVPPEWLRPGDPAVRVHSGFLGVYKRVRSKVHGLAKAVPAGRPVVVCGHSLGGALATLAALDLCSTSQLSQVSFVSFGQPQVGDGAFAALFDSRVPSAVRVVNPFDPVPRSLSAVFVHTKGQYAVSSLSHDNPVSAHALASYKIALERPAWLRTLGVFAPLAYVGAAAGGVAVYRLVRG